MILAFCGVELIGRVVKVLLHLFVGVTMLDTRWQTTELIVTVLHFFWLTTQNLVEFKLRRPRPLKFGVRLLPHFQLAHKLFFLLRQRSVEEHFVLVTHLKLLSLGATTAILVGVKRFRAIIWTKLQIYLIF